MSHYTHYIDDSGKEPTIIEIKGEPYPEEFEPGVDAKLHEFNRITSRVADASSFYRRWQRYVENNSVSDGELRVRDCAKVVWDSAVDEYEKMVSAEAGE